MRHAGLPALRVQVTCSFTDGVRFYLVCRDVRARKEKELSLHRFMVSTSASLREPANAVLLSAAWLVERPCVLDDPDALFFVTAIRAACRFLLGIINTVMASDEVDSPALQPSKVIFCPALLIDDVRWSGWERRPYLTHLADGQNMPPGLYGAWRRGVGAPCERQPARAGGGG